MSWLKFDKIQQNDPWGGRKDGPGPPDIEEVFRKIRNMFQGSLGNSKSSGGGSMRGFNSKFISLILVIAVAVYFLFGFYQLDQQERGVIMRFGAVQTELQMPGLRWNWPIFDIVTRVNVTRIRNIASQSLMLTSDENIVDIKMSVQYLVSDPKSFVFEVRNPRTSLEHASESALRHVVGSSSMDNVLTEGREQVAIETTQRLQSYLDNYKTGITVVKVNIDDSQPPQQVAAAFDDVQKAQEDNQRLVNEANAYKESVIPKARGEASKQIEQAKAYKEQVIAYSEGEAERFSQLLKEYNKAKKITRDRLYIDALESILSKSSKILIDIESSNNLLYLPLDRLALPPLETLNNHSEPPRSSTQQRSNQSRLRSRGSEGSNRNNNGRNQ